MATQSAPPDPTNEKFSNPTTELEQPLNEDQQDGREINKQTSTGSVFVNSEPMREEQVQNAVKFLSHPKVRGSPVMYRRSFLEKKGLTKEEIDEAFRRVPDPSPSAQASNLNNDGQGKSSSNIQQQAPMQTRQSAISGPSGVVSKVGTVTGSRFQWIHAFWGVGILAISGAGSVLIMKKAIVPRLKSWIRKIVLEEDDDLEKKIDAKPSLAEEAAAAAKAAAAAATDVAKASQEMLYSKNEERKKFEEFVNVLNAQVREMKVMTSALQRLEGQTNSHGRTSAGYQEDPRASVTSSKQYANGKTEYDARSARSSSPPTAVEPQAAPHSKSYMEIMAMVQRGEKPGNIRDINDLPPNPNQQLSNPRLAPRGKPWEAGPTQNNSHPFLQSQGSGGGGGSNPMVQDNGVTYQINGESTQPWWQRKNVRITEIENEADPKPGASGGGTVSEPSVRWVPPQPPPVAMAEAAEAIRRPKASIQKEQMNDEQLLTGANVNEMDELQRITKVSESGGAVDIGTGSSIMSSNEIQEI